MNTSIQKKRWGVTLSFYKSAGKNEQIVDNQVNNLYN